MKMHESVEIDRPPEAVFAYVTDVTNDSAWQQMVVEAKFTSDGPVDVGTTGTHRVKFMGMTDNYGWKLHQFDAPNRAGWTFTSGPMTGKAGYTIEGLGARTRLTMDGDVQATGIRRMLTPIMGPMYRMQTRKELKQLKGILEDEA